jgi:hypothetical protein
VEFCKFKFDDRKITIELIEQEHKAIQVQQAQVVQQVHKESKVYRVYVAQ